MSAPPTGSITIELEPGEPIHGRLLDGEGTVRTFRGWLELCGAIERLRPQSAGRSSSRAADGDDEDRPS